MRVAIPPALLARIYELARAAFPAECCGYLTGADAVDTLVPCRNALEDGSIDAGQLLPDRGADRGFVIAGRELFELARSFDTDRPARIVYHSHTNGRAYFSDTDRAMALGGDRPAYPVQHLVVALTADGVTEAAQFAWSDDARDFVEIGRWTP